MTTVEKDKLLEYIAVIIALLGLTALALWTHSEIDWMIGNEYPKYMMPTIPTVMGLIGISISIMSLILAKRYDKKTIISLCALLLNLVTISVSLLFLGGWVYLQ